MHTELVTIDCPYCGESYDTTVDTSAGAQTYVEDCAVCCRPIVVTVEVSEDDALTGVRTRRENE
jgi:hypothetical protein